MAGFPPCSPDGASLVSGGGGANAGRQFYTDGKECHYLRREALSLRYTLNVWLKQPGETVNSAF